MLMDSANPEVQELLEFKCVAPLQTVHTFLEAKGGARLLEDPLLDKATAEILAGVYVCVCVCVCVCVWLCGHIDVCVGDSLYVPVRGCLIGCVLECLGKGGGIYIVCAVNSVGESSTHHCVYIACAVNSVCRE
jgi:hypothetical protein